MKNMRHFPLVTRTTAKRIAMSALGVGLGVALFAGCSTKMNGGGWMTSANGVDKANFGFSYDASKSHFEGTYHDNGANLHIKTDGVVAFATNPGQNDNCMGAEVSYESQGNNKGSGTARIAACDNGQ